MSKQLLCRLNLLLVTVLVTIANVYAQPKKGRLSPEAYIASFKNAAIADMVKTGVPASITMAQGMYESDYGNSPLAQGANNHFGIKCHNEWQGPTYHQDDDATDECFRKYNNVQESYDDHSYFLRSRDRYQSLFSLDITDYKGWAYGLKKAGYATNPQYAHKLIDLIERYNLNQLDVLGEKIPVAVTEQKTPEQPVTVKEIPKEKSTETETENETASTEESGSLASIFTKKTNTSNFNFNTINDVPVVRANKGDTWLKISRDNNLELWQVLEYNDADKNAKLREGDYVFLKMKKNRAAVSTHIVKPGETMRSISQQYGIRATKLYQMNKISFDAQPNPGDKLYLNKTVLLGVTL